MKIIWLCNIALPKIAKAMGIPTYNIGGWMSSLMDELSKSNSNIDFHICFPLKGINCIKSGKIGDIKYYAVPFKMDLLYSKQNELDFLNIIKLVDPDIVHIFGTEFPHTLAMLKAFNKPNKTVINIQGLVSIYAKHYYANLPWHVIYLFALRDLLKLDNIWIQRKKFEIRGKYEIEALQKCNHVIGRTDWDRACTLFINPKLTYHSCNEILRNEFYQHKWSLENCERYSILISQGHFPIKGLHYMLEAMPEILKKYPKTKLYVVGVNITRENEGLKGILKSSFYGKYIKKMIFRKFIDKYKLNEHVIFTGNLDEQAMCKKFLMSHVFVSCSIIENSSNSIAEAQILGVPVVASYVGGVANSITHGVDGYLYQHDAPYMLAYYVCQIFKDVEIAKKFSENEMHSANITHNRDIILNNMLNIYKELVE